MTCECGHGVDEHGDHGLAPCEVMDCTCIQFEPYVYEPEWEAA